MSRLRRTPLSASSVATEDRVRREEAVVVDGVEKAYGDQVALRGVSLSIARGEIVALLGRNGAGKTTLASLLLGLRRRDAGSILVEGVDPKRQPRIVRERTGFVPQDLGIYPVLTVRENLAVFGGVAKLSRSAIADRIADVAEALDLQDLLKRRAGTLSGGEKRRLHVGMALLHEPTVLLLDEPTVGADVESRRKVLATVRKLAAGGTAILYTTHYLHEVEELDATVVIIESGGVVAQGSVSELVQAHGDPVVDLWFTGPPPPLNLSCRTVVEGRLVRVFGHDTGSVLKDALRALNGQSVELERVEVTRPSLESAYLALTGRGTADLTGESAA